MVYDMSIIVDKINYIYSEGTAYEIKALDGVNTVIYKNKQAALEDMKSRFKKN